MKNIFFFAFLLTSIIFLFSGSQNINKLAQNKSTSNLNAKEIELLKHMREEEKLARDVYQYLDKKYDFFVFKNISESEQRHMDRMLVLLNENQIPDPASAENGVFNNPELQKLYNQLIAQGDISLTEALKAGATIEDLDIKDLITYKNDTSNPLLLDALDNLTCGSRNHMRAFVGQLELKDVTYSPQFISAEVYKSIIDGDHEKCGQMGNNGGKGKGNQGKNCQQTNCQNKSNCKK
ncbi:MAG: DUF2202 domain-containing protein [Flavobacteriaceae bacterium]|nr:DUF2202 domain-containing protein [Flavobacteriaceae bacterium]